MSGAGPASVVPARSSPKGFRTDIQALRAVAVLAVVLNHLWPSRLTGGYVGVDVFFVISGFLISSHIGREISRTGRVRLGRFYARRIRRLLPAAFVVLLFGLVAAYFLLPFPRWEASAHEAFASALYWENWLLAIRSVDYSALNDSASVSQHYWSLSVEEQFYLLWPILLLGLFKIRRTRAQLVGIAVIGMASLAFSAYFTAISKSQAYFVTPVRVWEFALGALIGLAGTKVALPRVASGLASLAGLAMILGSALLFDPLTEFPGYLALVPAVGTGLVIVAGTSQQRQWHTALSASAPVQLLGGVSYSLYLWHWPLIVLAPFALSRAFGSDGVLSFGQRAGVLALSFVLAYLSKVLVEDRGMSWSRLVNSTRLTFAGMVAGMVAVSLVAGGLVWTFDRHVAQAEVETRAAAVKSCYGASAMVPGSGCADPFGPANVVDMGPSNQYYLKTPDCPPDTDLLMVGSSKRTTNVCDFSGGAPSAPVVWLVGDSHAQQWSGPILDLAREHKWVLKRSYLGGCPVAKIRFRGYHDSADVVEARNCMNWGAALSDAIVKDRPAYVFTSFFARHEHPVAVAGKTEADQYLEGLPPYWNAWSGAGAQVVVLGDPPLNGDVRSPDCVALNPDNPLNCAVDRAAAQPLDPLVEAAKRRGDPNIRYFDPTDYFCDEAKCYGVVGNVVVYYDDDHLNLEFSRSLRSMIAAAAGLPER
ncbi:acyltransferase family protein [Amycolatopsis sp. H20-H5]|uniref:acyltransferase family protein n=1 Tax=Amycolatopsis sp. H20-H5 TaxID=3046309 RepID=UPI002DB7F915|nr:acyltransferase family protein [Amycolatopsis sp. H20-H5]MEC3980194.1 acyltransferase family protein [Amycolatopsis sp. H20-H5]